jgi:uncharacterized membrane protein HdeD (DUF308 family)
MQTSASAPSDVRIQRRWLIGAGGLTALLGLAAVVVPHWLASWVVWFMGWLFVGQGAFECAQWLIGRARYGTRHKGGSGSILILALLHLFLGLTLLRWRAWSVVLLVLVLAVALGIEGLLLMLLAVRLTHAPARTLLVLTAAASLLTAGLALCYCTRPDALFLVGLVLGAKLLLAGGVLVYVGSMAPDADVALVFGAAAPPVVEPCPASIYAVFYGPAFHCGIYVDDGQVVDYLTDGKVRLITWEEFLLGRTPQLWDYPDVPAAPPAEACAFARNLVGREHPYDAFRANCESLAIYCRSAGQARDSAYSQAAMGLEMMRRHPVLGSLVNILNRAASWAAYGVGGTLGKRFGFAILWFGNRVTNWLIVRPLERQHAANAAATGTPAEAEPTAASEKRART